MEKCPDCNGELLTRPKGYYCPACGLRINLLRDLPGCGKCIYYHQMIDYCSLYDIDNIGIYHDTCRSFVVRR